jgi:hypothetical protein
MSDKCVHLGFVAASVPIGVEQVSGLSYGKESRTITEE